ncbi:hypothetical protein CEP52_014502 [Fusarium oligoseptatum]|uniref:Uncharacterized protein n=1 Tax=Fusarium oligoseptatum TaxID=2604345 RepID=A0A428SLK0_9HYPO|nr:hypothetical protein CEP52_014502 [Fusarium oligoseptatum]
MAQTLPHFDLGLAYIADNNPIIDPPQRSRHTSEQVFQQVLNQVPRSEVLEWTDQQDILIRIVGLQPRFQAWETLVQVINGPGCATVQDVKDAVEIIWKNFVRGLYSSLSDFRRDQVVEEPSNLVQALGALESGRNLDTPTEWTDLGGSFPTSHTDEWRSVDAVRGRMDNTRLWQLFEPSIRSLYCSPTLQQQLIQLAQLR